jgi:secreted trypsin-like serine protease
VPDFGTLLQAPEIFGGAPSDDRKIVGITFMKGGSQYVCSGLLISYNRVLTAAHCACGSRDFFVTNGAFSENSWTKATLVSIFHSYNCGSYPPAGDDLALLGLPYGITQQQGLKVCSNYSILDEIRYGAAWFPEPPRNVYVAGYGFEGDNEASIGTRREVQTAINSFTCSGTIAQSLGCYPFGEFIAGAALTSGQAKDTCAGDSGGPAFLRQNGTDVPIGIVSRGLPVNQLFPIRGQCGSGGIYTHLGRHTVLEWLERNGVIHGSPICAQF